MIYGIGVDLVEIDRIRKVIFRLGNRFSDRILSGKEREKYRESRCPVNFLAKRFAAKEAASKAFGVGIGRGLFFKNFEICNDIFGKPTLKLSSYAKTLFNELSLSGMYLSLSDDDYYAFAVVIFEK